MRLLILIWMTLGGSQMPVAPVPTYLAPCPAYLPARQTCYDPQAKAVYWQPMFVNDGEEWEPTALIHDNAHAVDDLAVSDAERQGLKPLLGYRRSRPWCWRADENPLTSKNVPPCETFADTYTSCAYGERIDGYGRFVRWRRLCPLLRRLATN